MSRGYFPYLIIVAIGLVIFLPFIGVSHLFDWDEINFAESAREMLVTGNFGQVTVNFEPFWEKPPLFIWIQALCMYVFGVGEFAARLPNVLIMITTLCTVFYIGRKHYSEQLALLWVLFFAGSITPHLYGHSGIIDPLFNLFIFLSIYQLYLSSIRTDFTPWILSGLFLGLAVLTKGPAAGLIVGLSGLVIWVYRRYKFWFSFPKALTWFVTMMAVASLWFLPELIKNGPGFLESFLIYQLELLTSPVASHGQPWFYHFVVLAIGCVPASIVMLPSLSSRIRGDDEFLRLMKTLFWVVLILFSLVTTKIVHYSSLCYLPMAFLAAHSVINSRAKRFVSGALLVVGVLWAIILISIPTIGYWNDYFLQSYGHLINDGFTRANFAVDGGWEWFHFIPGIIVLMSFLWLRKGWIEMHRKRIIHALVMLTASLSLVFALIVPPVEKHVQHSVIEFYESIQNEDCYVDVYGYKSYAHYFYARMKPLTERDTLFSKRNEFLNERMVHRTIDLPMAIRKEVDDDIMNWMKYGQIDLPVYLVCQQKKIAELEAINGFEKVFERGGFAAFRRMPQ